MTKAISAMLLGIFVFIALLGLPILLMHSGHHVGCPLLGAAEVMCERTVIEHASIWSTLFATLIGLMVIFAVAVTVRWFDGSTRAHERQRLRYRSRSSTRPLQFQELYSRGIHNRKVPRPAA